MRAPRLRRSLTSRGDSVLVLNRSSLHDVARGPCVEWASLEQGFQGCSPVTVGLTMLSAAVKFVQIVEIMSSCG